MADQLPKAGFELLILWNAANSEFSLRKAAFKNLNLPIINTA